MTHQQPDSESKSAFNPNLAEDRLGIESQWISVVTEALERKNSPTLVAGIAICTLGYIGANASESWTQIGIALIVSFFATTVVSTDRKRPRSAARSTTPIHSVIEFLRRH